MKDIIKNLCVIIYLLGLGFSIGYSILNPFNVHTFLTTWAGSPLTVISSSILLSGWILFSIVIIWMILDKKREKA